MNIVFDLCGVMLEWQPNQIIDRFFQDPEIKKLVNVEIFNHPDWRELDRGTLGKDDAVKRASDRTGLSTAEIDRMIAFIPGSLQPIADTVKLIHSAKEKGHKLYILSNIPFFSIEYVEKEYPFFDLFEGVVVSCRVRMIKPEPEIYKHLLSKYNLQIDDTIFIDDTDRNIDAAASLGIYSIKFDNPCQCECELKNIGCL